MLTLILKAGWVAYPLVCFSVLALGVFLERLFTLGRLRQAEERAFSLLELALSNGRTDVLLIPQVIDAPIGQVVGGLAHLQGQSRKSVRRAAEAGLELERLRLRRYLGTLATIGSTAPFIGLFGTVLGVMEAFQAMSGAGLNGELIAAGISEALSATALGLLVAIPAVMAYNYLVGRTQALLLEIEGHLARLIPLLCSPAPPQRATASGRR